MEKPIVKSRPLRVCLLSYRSDPYCGGQGVYVKYLSRAIKDLGHHVDVISGPPGLSLDAGIGNYRIQSLDLYNPDNLFRMPLLRELSNPINILEWLGVSTMGFPEPLTFGMRVEQFLSTRLDKYDIIHDNQSLSYGIWNISKRKPMVATIHHPMTKDREIAVKNSKSIFEKLRYLRWYSFIGMQKRVSKVLPKIITVSCSSKKDIAKEFKVPCDRIRVVPNGVDTNVFRPLNGIRRHKNRIIVISSSETHLKGLTYLLKAFACLVRTRVDKMCLIVVGSSRRKSKFLEFIQELGIGNSVEFAGRITTRELVVQYARATIAVVPSLYEGFGLPAGEAMACEVPVVSTSGGALSEVVGGSGILVSPQNYLEMFNAINDLLNNPFLANYLGKLGRVRIKKKFNWSRAAKKTLEVYKEVLN